MPDLAGMLASLTKGPESDPQGRTGSILFNGRAPAAEPISLLDRSANLFERIHKTYIEKNQHGLVGVF
jgi:hypothetical protein